MHKVKIITDSASDLPSELVEKYNISMLPMGVIVGDKTYLDRVELDSKTFFKMMKEDTSQLPKTVMPSVELIEKEFRNNLERYEHQIYVCISSKGSGTFGVANMVKNQIEEELGRSSNITVIDSYSYSAGYGLAVCKMAELAYSGAGYDDVIKEYEKLREKINVLLVIDDLMHLQRGGRIKPSVAFVGGMLGIKPMLTINDGLIDGFGKERGKRRGMEKVIDIMLSEIGDPSETCIWLVHADAYEDMEILKGMITERITPKEVVVNELGACIGVHTGSGLVGIVYNKK